MNVSISENNNLFHNVVLKYGRENFTLSILKECSIEELNYYERKYINLFHSNDIQFGYNKTSGGDALSVWTEEHRKHHSEKIKEFYKNLTDEDKMKLNKFKYPKIRCIETNECHWSGEWKKLGYRHVLEVAKGERNHSKNLHFEFVSM